MDIEKKSLNLVMNTSFEVCLLNEVPKCDRYLLAGIYI